MYSIDIYLQSPHEYSEVIPSDLDGIELFIEDVVSQALLEFFQGGVIVKKVTVRFVPPEDRPDERQIRH